MQYAAANGKSAVLSLLIGAGGDVNIINNVGQV